ncbi:unnamed protein product [Calypogeia fissa]
MAAVVTAASLSFNALIAICGACVGLVDKYYVQEDEWGLRMRSLNGYKKQLRVWKEVARARGLSSHPPLLECLEVALERFQDLAADIERKEGSRTAKIRRKLSRTLFSNLVGNSLQQVDDAFGDIRKFFETKEAAAEVLDKEVDGSVHSDCFSFDSRYVHLEETETKIFEALDDDVNGPPVVLVYSGAGSGKSTVVRNTAAYYNPEEPNANRTFECVVLEDRGSRAAISFVELIRQLIRRLGGKPVHDEGTSRSIANERRFRSLLQERKMLLILDNLGDGDLDEKFVTNLVWMGVKGLKLLITAQLKSVCKGLDPKSVAKIPIQKLDKDTATKILAVHAGFENQEIPSNLLKYGDKLIAKSDCLPLALAAMGGAIDHRRNETEKEWKDLYRDLSQALKFDQMPEALYHLEHLGLWSTLNLIITTGLCRGARRLLLVTHALASVFSYIPESLIELSYDKLGRNVRGTFSGFRKELYDRQLITIISDFSVLHSIATRSDTSFQHHNTRDTTLARVYHQGYNSEYGVLNIREDGTFWKVHALQKLFIENVDAMRDVQASIKLSLFRAAETAYESGHRKLAMRLFFFLRGELQVTPCLRPKHSVTSASRYLALE